MLRRVALAPSGWFRFQGGEGESASLVHRWLGVNLTLTKATFAIMMILSNWSTTMHSLHEGGGGGGWAQQMDTI